MNWQRGALRLWIVLSVIWIGVVVWSAPELPKAIDAIRHHAPSDAEISAEEQKANAVQLKLEANGCWTAKFTNMPPYCKLDDVLAAMGPDTNVMTRDDAWKIVWADVVIILALPLLLGGSWFVGLWVWRGLRSN